MKSQRSNRKSDHFDGKRFFSPGVPPPGGLKKVLKWKLTTTSALWPKHVVNEKRPTLATAIPASECHVTVVNHATYLIQLSSMNILTDPVFSERTSPVSWAGPKRVREPGIALQGLPKIDVILISHNHYDHIDMESLKAIQKQSQPLVLTPLGNAGLIARAGFKNVAEYDWWDVHSVDAKTKVTLTPAQHWSGRGLHDRNQALWSGFVVQDENFKIFFAGDTGYGPHFKEIQKRFGPMDLSLLPIGAYEPRWFMKDQHMNPDDAVKAHLDLESRKSIGIHFGTFQLSDEAIEAPVRELNESLSQRRVSAESFTAPQNGETIIVKSSNAALD